MRKSEAINLIRGTTATIKLRIESEIDLRLCKQIWVTMRQGEKGDPGETPTIQTATQTKAGLMSADDKKSMDRELFRMLPKGGTAITTEETDLNSIEFTKVGNYYCSLDLTASTFKNTPTKRSFMMFVLSPLSSVYDNEETTQWCYRVRIMVTYTGEFFVQSCSSGSEAGKFDFGKWKKFILEEV